MEDRKPYWLNFRAPRDGEMHYDLNTYFPDFHYRKAVEQAGYDVEVELDDADLDDLRTDGGSRTQYYWSGDDGILYHGEKGEDMVLPFFDSVEDAERFLEHQAETYGKDRYGGMVLRKTGNQKVEEATDVLTDQSGLADFAPDGGYPEPPDQDQKLQIENPQPDRVWFWYDPAADQIVQEEVAPYDVRGVFESEEDADRFVDWYADRYGLDDTSHLELYAADLAYQGQGYTHLDEGNRDEERVLPEQADLASFPASHEAGEE